jgi:hypothetical protein
MGLSKSFLLEFQEDLVSLFFEVFLSGGFWVFSYSCPRSAKKCLKIEDNENIL